MNLDSVVFLFILMWISYCDNVSPKQKIFFSHQKIIPKCTESICGFTRNEILSLITGHRNDIENSPFPRKLLKCLLLKANDVLTHGPKITHINIKPSENIIVVGDIHGSFSDVQRIFNQFGTPNSASQRFIFNGDMIDRGDDSIPVILTLLVNFLFDPKSIFINRGNHETGAISSMYGFASEIMGVYGNDAYELFLMFNNFLFENLPVISIINEEIFVSHGGIPGLSYYAQHNTFPSSLNYRFNSFLKNEDVLWSDPRDIKGVRKNRRGRGYYWGPNVTEEFLQCSGMSKIIRSHEYEERGIGMSHGGKVWTVFSSSDYVGRKNEGAIVKVENINGVLSTTAINYE